MSLLRVNIRNSLRTHRRPVATLALLVGASALALGHPYGKTARGADGGGSSTGTAGSPSRCTPLPPIKDSYEPAFVTRSEAQATLVARARAACAAENRDLGPATYSESPSLTVGIKRMDTTLDATCCRKPLVAAKVCVGDVRAPVPSFEQGPWNLDVRPVYAHTSQGDAWFVQFYLSQVVLDACDVRTSSLSGQLAWKGQDGTPTRVPFACDGANMPAEPDPKGPLPTQDLAGLIPRQVVVGQPGKGRAGPAAIGRLPCLTPIPPAEGARFQKALSAGEVAVHARVDLWDVNRNHTAMAFFAPTLSQHPVSLQKQSFNRPSATLRWSESPSPDTCVGAHFSEHLTLTTQLPIVQSAAVVGVASGSVTVAKARLFDASGTACGTQPSRRATLAHATVVYPDGTTENLADPVTPIPCVLDPSTDDATCAFTVANLRAQPGMKLRASILLVADMGDRLVLATVNSP